ncbi:MAG TPA: hypothetical protein VM889_06720 [Candidatus Thermoplasmatota archaeon]|nr:hypothetical protein [Candidatus Thermoplasmatota archaeon]
MVGTLGSSTFQRGDLITLASLLVGGLVIVMAGEGATDLRTLWLTVGVMVIVVTYRVAGNDESRYAIRFTFAVALAITLGAMMHAAVQEGLLREADVDLKIVENIVEYGRITTDYGVWRLRAYATWPAIHSLAAVAAEVMGVPPRDAGIMIPLAIHMTITALAFIAGSRMFGMPAGACAGVLTALLGVFPHAILTRQGIAFVGALMILWAIARPSYRTSLRDVVIVGCGSIILILGHFTTSLFVGFALLGVGVFRWLRPKSGAASGPWVIILAYNVALGGFLLYVGWFQAEGILKVIVGTVGGALLGSVTDVGFVFQNPNPERGANMRLRLQAGAMLLILVALSMLSIFALRRNLSKSKLVIPMGAAFFPLGLSAVLMGSSLAFKDLSRVAVYSRIFIFGAAFAILSASAIAMSLPRRSVRIIWVVLAVLLLIAGPGTLEPTFYHGTVEPDWNLGDPERRLTASGRSAAVWVGKYAGPGPVASDIGAVDLLEREGVRVRTNVAFHGGADADVQALFRGDSTKLSRFSAFWLRTETFQLLQGDGQTVAYTVVRFSDMQRLAATPSTAIVYDSPYAKLYIHQGSM